MTKISLMAVFFLFSTCLYAKKGDNQNPRVMNAIKYEEFKNFPDKWKLVTVRFRKDTEEMRYTYANDLAYKTLMAGKTDYPDGAVFGKIGVRTGTDPLFESSVIPNGARRYQLMVRNKKKYADYSGWGYALFDERGIPFPEDHVTQVKACASCHDVAAERGYIFSQLANTSPRKEKAASLVTKQGVKIHFKMVPRDSTPPHIQKFIPENFNFIRIMVSDMTENLFQGTLEEIRPMLSKETLESRQPAILMSGDGSRFSLVVPENLGILCNDQGKLGLYMKSYMTVLNSTSLSELNYCFTR